MRKETGVGIGLAILGLIVVIAGYSGYHHWIPVAIGTGLFLIGLAVIRRS